jgi:Sec-independent protein translocase protein TatA
MRNISFKQLILIIIIFFFLFGDFLKLKKQILTFVKYLNNIIVSKSQNKKKGI